MALIKTDFFSNKLKRAVSFYMCLPNDTPGGADEKNYKTLYLLHGFYGAAADWLMFSRVCDLSAQYNLAIVMPSGENSFFTDLKGTGGQFGQYVGVELVEYTRRTFALSARRCDTFIAGLSMGGYGALRNGLLNAATFSKIAAFSCALIIDDLKKLQKGQTAHIADYDFYERCFGDLSQIDKSMNDPRNIIDNMQKEGRIIPDIYLSCGDNDYLIEQNKDFMRFLTNRGVAFTFAGGEGQHNWAFWANALPGAIKWMLPDFREA